MLALWAQLFVQLCSSTEPRLPISFGPPGVQKGRSALSLSLLHPQPLILRFGAVLAWSSLRCLILVYGSETAKTCWSGLSLLILSYSNGLLCLSC